MWTSIEALPFFLTQRSYWIPGSYAPPWSEKCTSLLKAVEKEGLQGGKGDNSWVGRHRHIHDPGIQQEPGRNMAHVRYSAARSWNPRMGEAPANPHRLSPETIRGLEPRRSQTKSEAI